MRIRKRPARRPVWRWLTPQGWLWVVVGLWLVIVLAFLLVSTGSRPCHGAWCPELACYGPTMCRPCVCMSRNPGDGECVQIEAVPRMRAEGYRLVE